MTQHADRIRRLVALLAVVALAGFAAACGDDDDDGDDNAGTQTQQTETQPAPGGTETTETTPAPSSQGDKGDPEGAFLAFQTALADGDADEVCGSLTPSAVKQAEEASIGGKCDTWVKELSGVYDAAAEEKLKNTKVDSVEEKGDTATVKYTSPILNIPVEVEMQKDGDTWKISKLAEGV